jgi:murein DD-endopeptidase MepM/ murein hydrolase activator NlpD
MRQLVAAFVLMLALVSRPASATTTYYFPMPYPSTLDTNLHHIWDGWINNLYYNKTFVRDAKLQVGGWGDKSHAYIKFDLKGLPVTVNQAILWLRTYPKGDGSTPVNFDIWRVTSSWGTSMTWDTQPSVQFFGSSTAPPTNVYWGFDITQTYRDWKSGVLSNHGFGMGPWSTNNQFNEFRSSRYTDRAQRPHLQLDFTPPVPVPNFKMPLPGNISWLVSTETGGYDCKGLYDPNHDSSNWFSIDFSWRNKNASGNRVYADPNIDSRIDIPVIAAAGGTVEAIGPDPNHPNGYYVVVDHDYDRNINTGFTTRYIHLKYSPGLFLHQEVAQGDRLGYMGTTGKFSDGTPSSTGVHLHFGVRYNNNGAVTRSELTYVTMDGLLLKGYQTECANGDYTRYYPSSNRPY